MRTLILATALAAAGLLASAPASADTYSSERCGSSVITLGDPVTKLDACGTPWRVVQLQNGFGAAVGERWEFKRDTGLLMITVSGGKVVSIQRV